MDRAVTVAVVAYRAVKEMITENTVKCFSLRLTRRCGIRADTHSGRNGGCTCPDKLAINLDHAGIASLDWTKLRVVTHLRDFAPTAVDDIDEALISLSFLDETINCYTGHAFCPSRRVSYFVRV